MLIISYLFIMGRVILLYIYTQRACSSNHHLVESADEH